MGNQYASGSEPACRTLNPSPSQSTSAVHTPSHSFPHHSPFNPYYTHYSGYAQPHPQAFPQQTIYPPGQSSPHYNPPQQPSSSQSHYSHYPPNTQPAFIAPLVPPTPTRTALGDVSINAPGYTFKANVPLAASDDEQPEENFSASDNGAAGGSNSRDGNSKRKRKKKVGKRRSTKRKQATSPVSTDNVTLQGVGPPSQPPSLPATTSFPSLVQQHKNDNGRTQEATDVWYFFEGVMHHDINDLHVVPQPIDPNPSSRHRPTKKQYRYLLCRYCKRDEWKAYTNHDGQTKTLCKHLQKCHREVWCHTVKAERLKGWETVDAEAEMSDGTKTRERPFEVKGFYEQLVRFIAAYDEALNIMDCPEFRDLLDYNSEGRVSFTSDVWSRENLDAHMAVATHWIAYSRDGHLMLRSSLIAFRRLEKGHSGKELAEILKNAIQDINCLHKIGFVTLDNASNNNTCMEEMAEELRALDISFSNHGNRIRCFPHVINLVIQEFLCYLPATSDDDAGSKGIPLRFEPIRIAQELEDDPVYRGFLEADIVAVVGALARDCRSSSERRLNFKKVLTEGNAAGGFGDPKTLLRVVTLLRDCVTRWGSTFFMIDRVLELILAIEQFIDKYYPFDIVMLTEIQVQVLADIREVLYVPYSIQESVSAERTPTLHLVIPLYEELLDMLNMLKDKHPKLSHALSAAIEKLEEYLSFAWHTRIYGLSVAINPMFKFEYIRKRWGEEAAEKARAYLREAMLAYQREKPVATSPGTSTVKVKKTSSGSGIAARSQESCLARTKALKRTLQKQTDDSGHTLASEHSDVPDSTQNQAATDSIDREARDRVAVDKMLTEWEEEGVMAEDETFDLIRWWDTPNTKEAPANRIRWDLIFRVAMDVLPAQASAVPCERVFSSSKQTDASQRTNPSPEMFEVLQILKYSYREVRYLEDSLLDRGSIIEVLDLGAGVAERMIQEGRMDELLEMLKPLEQAADGSTDCGD